MQERTEHPAPMADTEFDPDADRLRRRDRRLEQLGAVREHVVVVHRERAAGEGER